jgi:hypothetical protein
MQITSPVTNAMPVRRVEEHRHGNPSIAQRRDGSPRRVRQENAANRPEQMQETVAKSAA